MITRKTRKDSIANREGELKHLLSLELTVDEIADRMGLGRSTVYAHIERRGWQDFIQPGLRKKQWREDCAAKKNDYGALGKENESLVATYTNILFAKMVDEGFNVLKDDVMSEANLCFTKCLAKFNPEKGMAFKSYFQLEVEHDMVNFKKKLARQLKRQGYTEVGKGHEQEETPTAQVGEAA